MTTARDSFRGTNAERSRSHNRRVVLGQVRDAGRIGRAAIARATGLTTQAVSNIIAELHEDGLLVEDGRQSAGRGLPAVLYALNPRGGFALGVEIRPGTLFLSILDLAGQEIFSLREPLDTGQPEAVAARILGLRDAALKETGIDAARLFGAGIVLPGPFGTTGLSDAASELPAWQPLDVGPWFSDHLDLPVTVENDANAAAMAERVSGVAREIDSFACLYFGAGLGLGMVQGGQILRGAYGNAGEIGHCVVPGPDGAQMLEHAVSRIAAERHLRARGLDASTSDALAQLHADRDPALRDWLGTAAAALSHAINMIENMLDPETIVLGGAMPAPLVDDLIARLDLSESSVANRADRRVARVLRGACGRMTAARGAAALAINQSFTPRIAGH